MILPILTILILMNNKGLDHNFLLFLFEVTGLFDPQKLTV